MPKANIQGIDLHYEVHGNGAPLVLIQGFGGGHRGWFFQTHAFKRYFQVVTFDDIDIWKSDKLPKPLTIPDRADKIISLMDHLHIEKAHVLGVSRGGMIAQEVAINYPDRVGKLVLASTAASGRDMSEAHPEMMEVLIAKKLPDFDINSIDFARTIETMISLSFNGKLYRNTLLILAKIATSLVKVKSRPEQLEALEGFMSYSAVDRLHLIKSLTLVITGGADRIVPSHCSEILAEKIPKAKLIEVQGGSHAFFIEMRGRFNREVLDFLKDESVTPIASGCS
jgi:pimeloyl-ACP methyl ester carboxylesterase